MTQAERLTLDGLNGHVMELKSDVGELKADVRAIKEALSAGDRARKTAGENRWRHRELVAAVAVGLIYPAYNLLGRLLHW